jgi:hypothetical protein
MATSLDPSLTEQAQNMFWTETDSVPGKEYIESLNTVTTFYDYVYKYAKDERNGFSGSKDDADALAKFVFSLSTDEKRNVPRSSLNTVKNWLKKSPPTSSGRENVYRLCFALGLNANETKVFFLKAYLSRPFNYKELSEAVYFFCMNNSLKYQDAERIIKKINDIPETINPDAESVTEQIGRDISEINTEDEFIKYFVDNRSGFTVKNKTAIEKVNTLIDSCKALATKECGFPIENIDELLSVITGYYARKNKDKKNAYKFSISKSNFPKLIKENFPQRQQIENIINGEATFDVIRKTLILLNFYDFFARALEEEDDYRRWFDEFVDETNVVLDECGYVQLYWRHPYDWMFGFCANMRDVGGDPLEHFRVLIEEFYLKQVNPDGIYDL